MNNLQDIREMLEIESGLHKPDVNYATPGWLKAANKLSLTEAVMASLGGR